jgi:NAD(P)-dependent dehydrogenase (short-subunit alcohol dehydrogenase family)
MAHYKTVAQAFDLSEERIIITGGGTGLGFGMAQCVAQAGAQVIITGRREAVLQEAVQQLGASAGYRVHDVTDFDTSQALIASLEAELGPVTTVINNAGYIIKKPIEETTPAEFEAMFQTHVTGALALSQAAIPSMKAAGHGHLLFIVSMAALFGLPNVIAYTAAKSALQGMVRGMATELSPHGIRVNAIAPGWIWSELLQKTVEVDPERKRKVLARTPMGRFGQAEDIGWAAVYLCAPVANFLTGVCLPVDGGIAVGF